MLRIPRINAKAIIAILDLRFCCDYRMVLRMDTHATAIIDALGGTSEVARDIEAPPSTVQSWKKIGIPQSRLAHLRLLAQSKGVTLPERTSA